MLRDSNSEENSGYGSTVGSCSNKKSKLDICVTPSTPIKTTITSKTTSSKITSRNPNLSKITSSKITKIKHSPPSSMNEKGKVMAVVAVAKYGHAHHHKSSKKAAKKKLI